MPATPTTMPMPRSLRYRLTTSEANAKCILGPLLDDQRLHAVVDTRLVQLLDHGGGRGHRRDEGAVGHKPWTEELLGALSAVQRADAQHVLVANAGHRQVAADSRRGVEHRENVADLGGSVAGLCCRDRAPIRRQ